MDTVRFFAANTQPNPVEVDYWVDLYDNPYGGSIKYYNGTEWVRLAASGGIPDLSKYYTKVQVNQLLNDKASVQSVESKVDDEEVKDVIKNITFRTSNPNEVQMVLAKYDTTTVAISLPKASDVSAGIVTSDDFKDFVKQVDFQQLYQELYDSNSNIINAINDIKAKYQKKLTAGSNIKISDDNVISATISIEGGDIDIDGINNKIDELTGKLQEEVTRSTNADNKLTRDLSAESTTARAAEKKNADNIASNTQAIQKEVTDRNAAIKVETDRATAAENKLANDIVTTVETEKDRAEGVEQVIINDLAEEVTRAKAAEQANKTAINKEVTDRQSAIATEVDNRNQAIDVEKQRALKAEAALDTRITTHTNEINTALATKADKSTTYNKTEVDSKISTINQTKQDKLTAGSGIKIENNIISSTLDVQLYKIVDSLPSQDVESGKIYLVLSETTTESNKYTEYVYINGEWEIIGSYTANVDLSGYLTKTDAASTYQPKGNYALKTDIPDVSTKADTSYVNAQIQTVNTEINKKANKADLHAVATSGNYNDLTNKLKAGSGVTITDDNTINTSVDLSGVTNSISELDSKIEAEISRATIAESNKVDKIVGKGLSTNDYTTAEKNKLNGIAAGAEVNVQSDWNAVSGDAMILNKPTSLPASDVSDWAKAKTKPSYTAAEVGAVATSSYTANDVLNKLKTVDGSGSGLDADTVRGFTIAKSVPSDAKFTDTTYIFANGTDGSFTVTPSGGSAQKVSIGKPAEAMSVKYNTSDITKAENILLGGTNKYHFAIQINKDGNNVPYAELNTGSSGMNPIYVRQYGAEGIRNSITLLDPNGNTLFPNTVTANKFIGSLQGTADNASKLNNLTFSSDYNDLINDSITQTITDTSNSIWFVKVTVLTEWNTGFFSLYLESAYNNNLSKVAVQLHGINGFRFYRSNYNDINITRIAKVSGKNQVPILYLQMRGSTNAKLTVSSSRRFTLEKIQSIPDGINMIDMAYTDYVWGTIGANTVRASQLVGPLQGNSDTATKLATPRSINGTNFDGSANITTANWGTARNITIGKTAKSVNGSANVSWSASEIADNATTTTDGWMSKEDKLALANLNSDFYGREQVTVQLKKENTNFAGNITIKNKDTEEVIATSTTGNLTARIIYGVKYVISVPDVDGYYQNTVLEYTASQLVRNIDVVYNTLVINTITIDMTITDPATMISGDVNGSVIQNIRNNTHRYAAKKTAEGTVTICQLDDNNSNLFHSGESSTSDSFDRFVRIPRFCYKVDDSNPDIQKISFCMNKVNNTWQEWDGNDLIGCYETMISSNKLYSYSGFSSSASISYTQFKQFASSRGTGYRLVTWQQHCMVAILFYAIYGHTNCQEKVGKGTSSSGKVTGYTDSIGMADTVAGGNGDSNSINFLGLENWWGNKSEFIDNIRFNYTSEVSKPNFSIQEYDETWRHVQVGSSTSGWKHPIKLRLGNKLDMFPFDIRQDDGGSSNTGFCDGQYYNVNNDLVVLRSYDGSDADGGVAYLKAGISASNANSSIGSRLAFRGNIIEEKNVQTFLSL